MIREIREIRVQKIIFALFFTQNTPDIHLSCKAQSESNGNQNINQKKKSKNGSVKRIRCIRAIRERFLILSSVAAGSQSATQQIECRITGVLSWPLISRIPRMHTGSHPKQIRPTSVRKKYLSVWIIDHASPESHEYIPDRNLNNSSDSCDSCSKKNISVLVSMIHRVRPNWI